MSKPSIKRATRCTKAPAYAGSGKGSHHLVYCTQPYPVFTQEAISRTWTRDLSVTWQQLYLSVKAIYQRLKLSAVVEINSRHKIDSFAITQNWNETYVNGNFLDRENRRLTGGMSSLPFSFEPHSYWVYWPSRAPLICILDTLCFWKNS